MIAIQFQALGTSVEGIFRADSDASTFTNELKNRIAEFENRFSRFHSDSELSNINAQAGAESPVSEEMIAVLKASEEIRKKTDGCITPLIGNVMKRIGYDATFESLPNPDSGGDHTQPSASILSPFSLNEKKKTVTLPPGTALDFGGIGKGYLLERVAPLIEKYTSNYWLSLGGDMIVSGEDKNTVPWVIGVQNPFSLDKDIGELHMPKKRYAVATSGITKRKGVHDGEPWHHIIDPKTGRPAETDVVMATIISPSALDAEAFAKLIIIEGSQKGMLWAEANKIPALAVTKSEHVTMTTSMRPYAHIYEK